MRFFEFNEIALSIIVAILHGGCMGILNLIIDIFTVYVKPLFLMPFSASKVSFTAFRKTMKETEVNISLGKIAINLKEFIFVLFYGLSLIVLFYAYSDGIPRLYLFIASYACFVLVKKFLDKYLKMYIFKVFLWLYKSTFVIFSVVLFPLSYLFRFVGKTLKYLIKGILNKIINRNRYRKSSRKNDIKSTKFDRCGIIKIKICKNGTKYNEYHINKS